jgi:hypothetical protein
MQTKSGLIALLAVSFAASGTAVGQTAFKNSGPNPFRVSTVTLDGREDVAGLYAMGGETLHVGAQGEPIGGSGDYEALPGKYFPVQAATMRPVMFEDHIVFPSLRVDKVAWDNSGQLTAITGLNPAFFREGDKTLAITSDTKNPKLANGNLYLTLEGRGATEYWIKIKFGRIVAIGKHQNAAVAPTATASTTYRALTADDGFALRVYGVGDGDITERGTITGKLNKLALAANNGNGNKEIEIALTNPAFTDGRVETKQFGVFIIQYAYAGYWTITASESQIQKMKAFLASQPGK